MTLRRHTHGFDSRPCVLTACLPARNAPSGSQIFSPNISPGGLCLHSSSWGWPWELGAGVPLFFSPNVSNKCFTGLEYFKQWPGRLRKNNLMVQRSNVHHSFQLHLLLLYSATNGRIPQQHSSGSGPLFCFLYPWGSLRAAKAYWARQMRAPRPF